MRNIVNCLPLLTAILLIGCSTSRSAQEGQIRGRGGILTPAAETTVGLPNGQRAVGQLREDRAARPNLVGNLFNSRKGTIPDELRRQLRESSIPEYCPGEGWLCVDDDGNVFVNTNQTHVACYGSVDVDNIYAVGNWSALWHPKANHYKGVARPDNWVVLPMGYWMSRGWVHHDWTPFFFQLVELNPGSPYSVEGQIWGKQGGVCDEGSNHSQSWEYLPGMEPGGGVGDVTGEADSGVRDIYMVMVPYEPSRYGYTAAFPNMSY